MAAEIADRMAYDLITGGESGDSDVAQDCSPRHKYQKVQLMLVFGTQRSDMFM